MSLQDRCGQGSAGAVVGIDGSSDGTDALAWAVANAQAFGPLTPIVTYHVPTLLSGLAARGLGPGPEAYRTSAEARLAEAIEAMPLEARPDLAARASVVEAHPGPGLCGLAADADLLVVGTRGRSGVTASLLGSVSSYCVRHATVPVAVIPPGVASEGRLARVAVGLDGSASARQALRWAIDHTDPGGRIIAVAAAPMWGYAVGPDAPPDDVLDEQLLKLAERSVSEVVAERTGGPDVEIWTDRRDARVALRDLPGPPADLLVVGARGLSEVPFLLLGSVSSALAHHPLIPTVIVRTTRPTTLEAASP